VVGRIGETIRLQCPVAGKPTPMLEWSKDGDKVDFMWERYKAGKRGLRIRNLNEDDTGVFTCKAVNGFGSAVVRVELVVVDPRNLPDDSLPDVAPPVFTSDTLAAPRRHTKEVGETFEARCEALGSPQPEIFWFKDGVHISDAVRFEPDTGASSLEFSVLGAADEGVYTCRARNMMGERTVNYTLEVRRPAGAAAHAIVTGVGPDATAVEGESVSLQCRVKSITSPHVKWLKRSEIVEGDSSMRSSPYSNMRNSPISLKVGSERYSILDNHEESPTSKPHEYVSRLLISEAREEDAGMYLCFVTNSGFGPLTYHSMKLAVIKAKKTPIIHPNLVPNNDVVGPRPDVRLPPQTDAKPPSREPDRLLILVICLSTLVLILLAIAVACVCRRKASSSSSSAASTASSSKSPLSVYASAAEIDEAQRPFVGYHHAQQQQHLMNNNAKLAGGFLQPALVPPPPNYPPAYFGKVYPASDHYQQQQLRCGQAGTIVTDSGFGSSPKETARGGSSFSNQYEVPYSHMAPQNVYASFGRQRPVVQPPRLFLHAPPPPPALGPSSSSSSGRSRARSGTRRTRGSSESHESQ